jgi:hypothetical protein
MLQRRPRVEGSLDPIGTPLAAAAMGVEHPPSGATARARRFGIGQRFAQRSLITLSFAFVGGMGLWQGRKLRSGENSSQSVPIVYPQFDISTDVGND